MSGSAYRPIVDTWILARAKLLEGRRYYGAYPGGFPERARVIIGAFPPMPVLHVCGGMARFYPYRGGFGPNDKTLDLDPACEPDFCQDARDSWPLGFNHILCDPPYSEPDADKYLPGATKYPTPGQLLRRAAEVLPVGGRVGMLHYIWPSPPKELRCIAVVTVLVGYNNRIRCFSVFEKTEQQTFIGENHES